MELCPTGKEPPGSNAPPVTPPRNTILTLLACAGWALWSSASPFQVPRPSLTIDNLRPGHSTRQMRWNTPDMKYTRGNLHSFVAGGYPSRQVLYDRGRVKAIKAGEIEINSKRFLVRGTSVADLKLKLGTPAEEGARQLLYRFPDYELLVRMGDDHGGKCQYLILAERLDDLDPRWLAEGV